MIHSLDKKEWRIKRNTGEKEKKMFMLVHYKTRNLRTLDKWTNTYPIDQLVDSFNMPLIFHSKDECLEALETWGVNVGEIHTCGFEIESIH